MPIINEEKSQVNTPFTPDQIFKVLYSLRVSALYHQALITSHKCHYFNRHIWHVLSYIGNVIFTSIRIKQMRTCKVRFSPPKRDQSTLRTHISRGKPAVLLG